MHKLKLDLDNLRVESFATNPDSTNRRGTVHGNLMRAPEEYRFDTEDDTCTYTPDMMSTGCYGTQAPILTCGFTCGWTCANTCWQSCLGSCVASCQGPCV